MGEGLSSCFTDEKHNAIVLVVLGLSGGVRRAVIGDDVLHVRHPHRRQSQDS